ncbi:MAG TPA: hypothetical protein VH137_07840, partial [Gemmatimonadales bacterium]|nr:hypothetical protein [Gemmatimonadales bacterium]
HLRGPNAGKARLEWTRRVGFGSILLASAVTLGHVLLLVRAPAQARVFVQHMGSTVGGVLLVAGFDLLLDPLSGAACALACAVAIAGGLFLTARAPESASWKAWVWLELALGGSLLSFLAGGFVTMLFGWGLAAAAGAWLAGWSDRKAGAVRATRGALGAAALLLGASMLFREVDRAALADPAGSEPVLDGTAQADGSRAPLIARGVAVGTPALTFPVLAASLADPSADEHGARGEIALALALFVIAALGMSASTPPAGSPLILAAVSSGATSSAIGPFMLLRLDFLVPLVAGGAAILMGAGVVMVAAAAQRALKAPRGPLRWISLVCGVPAGLTCISLGTDGPNGAVLVLVSAGLIATLLGVTAARRGFSSKDCASPRGGLEEALLMGGPERAGALLMRFEHWVVDAIAGAAGVLLYASAWALDRFDVIVLALPADVLATRVVRFGRRVEPVVGGSLVRIAWSLLVLGLLAATARALWSAR